MTLKLAGQVLRPAQGRRAACSENLWQISLDMPRFWKVWRGFEVQHGNEDTFRDMLRVKRSVQAMFSQVRIANSYAKSDDESKRKG